MSVQTIDHISSSGEKSLIHHQNDATKYIT